MAANLIQKMLRSDPAARPTIDELLNDEFFTSGYLPGRLPTSCLTIAPRFSLAPSGMELSGRKPLTALNKGRCGAQERLDRACLASSSIHNLQCASLTSSPGPCGESEHLWVRGLSLLCLG